MTDAIAPNPRMFAEWADDGEGPVALSLTQVLLPVEGKDGVVFPPTFANIGYVIDELPDGNKVALIDSVGSQANRMEPLFKRPDLAGLVPTVTVQAGDQTVSLLDVGHRLADALVRSSDAQKSVSEAFSAYQKQGDASLIAKLAPTTLVFGAWDSRDGGAKLPRLVQSTIRAWGATKLRRAAQYTPPVDYAGLDVFSEEDKKRDEGNNKSPLAQRGFVHVPSGESPGGIVVSEGIRRDLLVNLIALRALRAADEASSRKLRRYILGLALAAATAEQDMFLRQGCLLTPDPAVPAAWEMVVRTGQRTALSLGFAQVLEFAQSAAAEFGVGPARQFKFDKAAAKRDAEEARKKDKKEGKKAKAAGQGEEG